MGSLRGRLSRGAPTRERPPPQGAVGLAKGAQGPLLRLARAEERACQRIAGLRSVPRESVSLRPPKRSTRVPVASTPRLRRAASGPRAGAARPSAARPSAARPGAARPGTVSAKGGRLCRNDPRHGRQGRAGIRHRGCRDVVLAGREARGEGECRREGDQGEGIAGWRLERHGSGRLLEISRHVRHGADRVVTREFTGPR